MTNQKKMSKGKPMPEIEKPCECEEIRSINVGYVPAEECFGCHEEDK